LNQQLSSPASHTTGVILVVLSAVIFSTAGLFSKGLHVPAWDIIFWRGLFAVLFTVSYATWRGVLATELRALGRPALAAAIVGGTGTAVYIPAFKFTSIANVSLIYAATPMLAALMAWAWLRQRPDGKVLAGCLLAIFGVALIVSGSLGVVSLKGDLLALAMAVALALLFVLYQRFPNMPASGVTVLTSVLLLPLAFAMGTPFENSGRDIAVMAAFGLCFAIATVTLLEGAKRLPAGETALLSLLEVPLAPLFAWAVLRDVPPVMTFVGGALIVVAILIPQLNALKRAN
jgi:drug/metabolite transporter (DMT)-like permease